MFGSQGVGSQRVGSQRVGSQGVGSEGVGSEGVGSEGVGSQGVGSQGDGSQGVGSQWASFAWALEQVACWFTTFGSTWSQEQSECVMAFKSLVHLDTDPAQKANIVVNKQYVLSMTCTRTYTH